MLSCSSCLLPTCLCFRVRCPQFSRVLYGRRAWPKIVFSENGQGCGRMSSIVFQDHCSLPRTINPTNTSRTQLRQLNLCTKESNVQTCTYESRRWLLGYGGLVTRDLFKRTFALYVHIRRRQMTSATVHHKSKNVGSRTIEEWSCSTIIRGKKVQGNGASNMRINERFCQFIDGRINQYENAAANTISPHPLFIRALD